MTAYTDITIFACNCHPTTFLIQLSVLRLLRTFARVLGEKIRHFKAKHGKLHIVGKLKKRRFQEKKM